MSTREPASYLISGYPHPLKRELEVPPERYPMSLPLVTFSIIITMNFVPDNGWLLRAYISIELQRKRHIF